MPFSCIKCLKGGINRLIKPFEIEILCFYFVISWIDIYLDYNSKIEFPGHFISRLMSGLIEWHNRDIQRLIIHMEIVVRLLAKDFNHKLSNVINDLHEMKKRVSGSLKRFFFIWEEQKIDKPVL